MILLIKDMDDPFEYSDKPGSKEEISLHPIHNLIKRIDTQLNLYKQGDA